jgi:triacylglycerol lipase
VGEIEDGVVVAFRGTLPLNIHQITSLLDWINDFEAVPVIVANFPGAVHRGFLDALNAVLPGIETQLQQQRTRSLAQKPLLVTGHSKGGAIAGLAAWKLDLLEFSSLHSSALSASVC